MKALQRAMVRVSLSKTLLQQQRAHTDRARGKQRLITAALAAADISARES